MKIGITCSLSQAPTNPKKRAGLQRYIDALADAGAEGIPLWRPRAHDDKRIAARAEKLAAQLDGVLVSGGKDLHPETYGEATHPDAKVQLVHPLRPNFEDRLIQEIRKRGKPLFGICYGCQYFNVLRGGTLWQDIDLQYPDAIEHRSSRHVVRLERDSMLHRIVGQTEFEVASFHHQAIARPAASTRVSAYADDKMIESIELDEKAFWLGVQWHPEWDRESEATQRLFSAFVSACRQ